MFTEDYLMRIINQVLVALMTAIGLRKKGKYSEARQALEQAIQQLTGLSPDLVDQLDDASILSMLSNAGQLDIERLMVLGDLYQENGTISFEMGQQDAGMFAYARALRLILEAVLADETHVSPENMGKIGILLQKLDLDSLPVDTQLALSDYYRRLLDMDAPTFAAAGISRDQVERNLARLQNNIANQ